MDLNHDTCYRAFQARDARFDGRLFAGVCTTGVYCRPICPARTPKRSNVTLDTSAAAAQETGFRRCLRCRSELSPEPLARYDTSRLVTRALALIASGALDEADVESLSSKMVDGISRACPEPALLATASIASLGMPHTHALAFNSIAQRFLSNQYVTGRRPTANELLRMAERWRPWRAYAAVHLWVSLRNACVSDASSSDVSYRGTNDVIAVA